MESFIVLSSTQLYGVIRPHIEPDYTCISMFNNRVFALLGSRRSTERPSTLPELWNENHAGRYFGEL